jgi:hypothetical protein
MLPQKVKCNIPVNKSYFLKFYIMKKTMKSIQFFAILAVLFLSACGAKDALDSINPLANSGMTATVDGKDYKGLVVFINDYSKVAAPYVQIGSTTIGSELMNLLIDTSKSKIEAGKTYTCGPGAVGDIFYATGENNEYETDATGGSGAIKVDSYDGKSMSGVFNGTLVRRSDQKKLTITNGKFSGKLIIN